MSENVEAPKYEILPKRDNRSAKKRVVIETKDTSGNKSQRQRQEDKKSGSGRGERRSKGRREPAEGTVEDDSENQGFTEWLRSNDGVDTMRLFVVCNSILVAVTMGWPHISKMFALIRELIYGEDEY